MYVNINVVIVGILSLTISAYCAIAQLFLLSGRCISLLSGANILYFVELIDKYHYFLSKNVPSENWYIYGYVCNFLTTLFYPACSYAVENA